jgi:hypothetical protein
MKKPKKAKEVFGKHASFGVVFSGIVYVSDEPADFSRKLFEGDEYKEVLPVAQDRVNRLFPEKPYLPKSMRKVIFQRTPGEGIIIGQTSKHEGLYDPGVPGVKHNSWDSDGDSSAEQASLSRKKTYTFWIVATGINTTVLAEKESSKIR